MLDDFVLLLTFTVYCNLLLISVDHFLDIDGFNQTLKFEHWLQFSIFQSPSPLTAWIVYQYIMYTCMSYEI